VALTKEPQWKPTAQQWNAITKRSADGEARVAVLGVASSNPRQILTHGRITIRFSKDQVGAPIFYREVNLPFFDAVKDPSKIRWRFGTVSSPTQPPVVLEGLPVCGNCHSFPRNGEVLAMDVDFGNNKGSYIITRVAEEMTLASSEIITWDSYKAQSGEPTFGLLSAISPDAKVLVSTVKD